MLGGTTKRRKYETIQEISGVYPVFSYVGMCCKYIEKTSATNTPATGQTKTKRAI